MKGSPLPTGPADVAILGGTGFTGAELLRLCAARPDLRVRVATGETRAGEHAAARYPSLAAAYPDLVYQPFDPDVVDGCDLVFSCLPHGASQGLLPGLVDRVGTVVDLAADFRMVDPAAYERWYGEPHRCPELLGSFAYGLPERYRSALAGARRVAAPGCYPTAAILALAPLLGAGAVEGTGIVVDAASGVSGAGAAAKAATQFTTVDGDFTAYGLLDHRHTGEMEQVLDAQVLFTPHLAPMVRGILATCYARPTDPSLTTGDVLAMLRQAYAGEPFVVVTDGVPGTKATVGANTAHVTARVDARTGWVIALCAIDNLVKGASGQALQAANVAMGVDETAGLPTVGLHP